MSIPNLSLSSSTSSALRDSGYSGISGSTFSQGGVTFGETQTVKMVKYSAFALVALLGFALYTKKQKKGGK